MIDSASQLGAFAQAYHDAAIAGADMRTVATVLESVRDELRGARRPFSAWTLLDNKVGEAHGRPEQPAILGLRAWFVTSIFDSEVRRITADARSNSQATWERWATALAEAVAHMRLELCGALANVSFFPPPALEAEIGQLRFAARVAVDERWPECRVSFQQLASYDFVPATVRARLWRIVGQIELFLLNRREHAKRAYDRASELAPAEPMPMLGQGEFLLRDNKIPEAEVCFQRALEADPLLGDACYQFGESARQSGNLDKARDWYEETLRRAAGHTSALMSLCDLAGERDPSVEGEKRIEALVERAITIEPILRVGAYLQVGRIYQQRDLVDRARRWYHMAEAANSARPDVHIALGNLCFDAKEYEKALACYRKAVEVAPESHTGFEAVAIVHETTSQWDAAARAYREAARRCPPLANKFDAQAAYMESKTERREAGVAELLSLFHANPDDSLVVSLLEQVAEQVGAEADDPRAALAILDDIHSTLGASYAERLEKRKAALSVARALRLNAEANELYRADAYAMAVPLYRKAVALKPEDAVLRSNLLGAQVGARFGSAMLTSYPAVSALSIEVAADLVPLVAGQDNSLTPAMNDALDFLRKYMLDRYGVKVPNLRVRENTFIERRHYILLLCEIPIVMGTVDAALPVPSGMPIRSFAHVAASLEDGSSEPGVSVPQDVNRIVRHLGVVCEKYLIEFVGAHEVRELVQLHAEDADKARLLENNDWLRRLTSVVRTLLGEQTSIAPFRDLCRRFCALQAQGLDLVAISEELRSLAEIRQTLPGNDEHTRWFTLETDTARAISDAIVTDGPLPLLAMTPQSCQAVLGAIRATLKDAGPSAVVVDHSLVRHFTRRLVEIEWPFLSVLARRELVPVFEAQHAGEIRLED